MAGKNVSQLTPVASLTGTELMYVSQGGVDKSATPDDIVALVPSGGGSSGTLGLVQLSDGNGDFDSDAGLSFSTDFGVLSVSGQVATPGVYGVTDLALGSATTAAGLNLNDNGSVTLTSAGGIAGLGVTTIDSSAVFTALFTTFTVNVLDGIDNSAGILLGPLDTPAGQEVQLIPTAGPVNLGSVAAPWRTSYFNGSVETVAVNASGNVDAATFSVADAPGIDVTITTADGAYIFTKGLLTGFTPA